MDNGASGEWGRSAGFTALVALGISLVFGLTFSYRTDYLGHFIAGFGGTLGLLTLGRAVSSWRWTPMLITLAAILIGIGTESSIFRLAIFDSIDFFNQSLGAALALCVTLRGLSVRLAPIAVNLSIAFLCLVAGFVFAFA